MPLSDFYGGGIDRSGGQVAVILERITATGTTDLDAMKNWMFKAQSLLDGFNEDITWQRRMAHTIAAWKVEQYTLMRDAASGRERTELTARLSFWVPELPVRRMAAGE